MSRGMMVMVLSILIINQGAENHFVCLWHGNLSSSEVIDKSDDDKCNYSINLNTEPKNYQGGIQKVREISISGINFLWNWVFTVVSWTTVSPDNRGLGNTWWEGAELHKDVPHIIIILFYFFLNKIKSLSIGCFLYVLNSLNMQLVEINSQWNRLFLSNVFFEYVSLFSSFKCIICATYN